MDAAAPRPTLAVRLAWAGAVLAAALVLMWTALVDHRPAVFYDTESYYQHGGQVAEALGLVGPAEARRLDAFQTPEQRAVNDTLMGARSPFYGLLLYAGERIGGLWFVAFCQCLAAAWAVFALLRATAPRAGPLACLGATAATAAATSLPFFASFIMPDIFAGLGLMAAIVLLVLDDRLDRMGRTGLWLLVLAAGLFHQSNLLVLALLAVAGGLVLMAGRAGAGLALRRGGLVVSAVLAAVLIGQVFGAIYQARTGQHLRRPPFLAVRMLADGPGRTYLRQACARAAPYELCRFKALALTDTEDMLWSEDPAKGIMNTSSHDQRVRLEDEEGRFVLGVIAHQPLGVIAAAARNWLDQLRVSYVEEPVRDPAILFGPNYFAHTSLPGMIPNGADCRPGGAGCKPRFTVRGLIWLHQGALLAALALLGWRLTRSDGLSALGARPALLGTDLGRLVLILVLVLVAVLANAAACGALSGAFPRYQARLVWLVPLVACATALCLGLSPPRREAERPPG